ncbi:hypothetical protein BHE74_00019292 [Ensete ventricosum]|nr:hypothetical protein BHE74_00019292 [Ensete ventricosum]
MKCATSSARCYTLKGAVGTVLAKSCNLASEFARAEQGIICSARRSSPKGMVVSETSSGKNVKRKVDSTCGGVTQEWVDEGELPRERTKNRRWRRPYNVGQGRVVERGEEATTSPEGLSYPKAIASIRKEVDSEERHSAAEADLPIAKEGTQMQGNR